MLITKQPEMKFNQQTMEPEPFHRLVGRGKEKATAYVCLSPFHRLNDPGHPNENKTPANKNQPKMNMVITN